MVDMVNPQLGERVMDPAVAVQLIDLLRGASAAVVAAAGYVTAVWIVPWVARLFQTEEVVVNTFRDSLKIGGYGPRMVWIYRLPTSATPRLSC